MTLPYDPFFDPSDPAEIAAKDQIMTMLANKHEALNAIARMPSATLKEQIDKDGWYLIAFRLLSQTMMTMLEERKIERGDTEVWPTLAADELPLSPGWVFLSGLCKDPNEPCTGDHAIRNSATLFRAIMTDTLEGVGSEEDLKAAMDAVPHKLKEEMKAQIDGGGAAALETVEHLGNWLWMLNKPESASHMTERLLEIVSDPNSSGSLDIEGLCKLQKELAKHKEEEEGKDGNDDA